MLKNNKHLFFSLLIASILAACGGGGGGSSGNSDGGNTPTTDTPAITVTSNLVGPENQVVAGRAFTITAKLTQGSSSNISFSNGSNTPTSISYNPPSCELTSAKNSCITTVNVGLTTNPISLNPGYTTNVNIVGSNAPAKKVTFAVVAPSLEVSTQPAANIYVGKTTTAKFDLPSTSIPAGSGTIDVTLSATNSAAVALTNPNCKISYANLVITSNTCSTTITGTNPGETKITASADHFTNSTTNQITIEPVPPTPVVDITTSLNNTNAEVVAGQSFTITATSVNGVTTTVNFSNAESTLQSVTYTPSSCNLTTGGACTTTAQVGVTTSVGNYTTNITYSGGSAIPNTSINYKVIQPKLAVLTQPESSIDLGESTTVGFTIESGMVPEAAGSVTLNLSLTNGLVGFATLNPTSCVISYLNKLITNNGCNNIVVSASNQSGITGVLAKASNFIQVQSNPIEVLAGTAPNIEVVSSIAGNQNTLYSGQSFSLTVNSVNSSSGPLTFSTTNPDIQLSETSCNLSADGSCVIQVTAPLGLTGYHGVLINYADNKIGQYNFTVVAPQLLFTKYTTVSSISKGNQFYVTFGIPSGQVPSGSGTLNINLVSTPTNIFSVQKSCMIKYNNNAVVENQCSAIPVTTSNYGIGTISASTFGFIGAVSNSVAVPQNIVYILNQNAIQMLASAGNGILTITNESTPVNLSGQATSMSLNTTSSGNYLYIQFNQSKQISIYSISSYSGLPENTNTTVTTKGVPYSIVFSNPKSTAYILTNSGKIEAYSILQNGAFEKLGNDIDSAMYDAQIISINPITGTVYLAGVISKYVLGFTEFHNVIYTYQPGNVGKLVKKQTINDVCSFQGLSVSPDGRKLVVACNNKVISYKLATDGSINSSSSITSQFPSGTGLSNIYFAPNTYSNSVFAYTNSQDNLYNFIFQDSAAPQSGWNNPVLMTNSQLYNFYMGFTGVNNNQAYAYLTIPSNGINPKSIGIYQQNIQTGELTLDTSFASNGMVSLNNNNLIYGMIVGPNF